MDQTVVRFAYLSLKDESIKLAHFPACAFLFTYPMLSGEFLPFDGFLFPWSTFTF
jgi:hypothetical protein